MHVLLVDHNGDRNADYSLLDMSPNTGESEREIDRERAGITGNVSIDDNGDINADYSLLDMDPDTGEFHVTI